LSTLPLGGTPDHPEEKHAAEGVKHEARKKSAKERGVKQEAAALRERQCRQGQGKLKVKEID